MDTWTLTYDDYDPDHEPLREALCTLGNGYFATRGAAPEHTADGVHYPGTYVAGCYNRLSTRIEGETVENESLVNVPNWLPVSFRIGAGDWFDLSEVAVLEYRQQLDLRSAVLTREVRFRDDDGRHTRLRQRRLVSMDQPHVAALETRIEAEDWSAELEVRSALDGRVTNSGVERYQALNHRHLEPLDSRVAGDGDVVLLEMQTSQSHVRIAQAARTRLWRGDARLELEPEVHRDDDLITQRFAVHLDQNQPLTIEKIATIFTSRDHAITDPALEAEQAAAAAGCFTELLERHRLHWTQLWNRFDFDVAHGDGTEEQRTEQVLRLHILHLIQTTSPHVTDLDAGVPARGLHGEAYRGHIFWDELFVFPLFNLRMPEITCALLRYRHRRLPEARRAARAAGYRGAMYPWQSGSNGREESQRLHLNPQSGNWIPDNSRLQRHINVAVAYNVWQHYQVTRDREFLAFHGAEMIFEIARFWASLVTWNEERGRYQILGVMGPDEYHDAYPDSDQPGIDDNAYTNVMVVWVMLRALDLRVTLSGQRFTELCELLELDHDEFEHWEHISRRMYVPFHDDGIISQFDGYDALEEFDWEAYQHRYGDIQRLDRILEAEDDTPNRYKVSKQADVLMLFYLFSSEELGELFERLGYPFEYETIPRNIEYYLARTSHGSTLSRVVHSWVLARSDRSGAWTLFREALESDVADIQGGTTEEGIHTGAMAGTVDLIQRCFTGIETRNDVLWLNPSLPAGLRALRLNIHYRGHALDVEVTPNAVRVSTAPCLEEPINLGIDKHVHQVGAGEIRELHF